MSFKVKVNFKQTGGGFKSKTYKFYDEDDFSKWYDKEIQDESYRKILDFEIINN